ncbi:hypothetical protein, conserved [Leishmania donovani]|uniref:RanBP2-type domain-containing protein n=2 Tax=Leishmania donovani TaxID=5661 RepID=E9BTK7_LEIDO|nr:hypothetical protein, conserved [Leishmania donovani]CBZ38586.1 hypothetical protein, conserved [Leishmania donovani]
MRPAVGTITQRVVQAAAVCYPWTPLWRVSLVASWCSSHFSRGCGTRSARADSARPYTTLTRSLRQSWKSRSLRPWMCAKESCRAVNQGIRKECESCGTEKPQLLGWKCVGCSTINYAGVRKCKKCADAIDKSKEFWMCAVCHENNRVDEIEDNSRCGFCGYDMAPHSVAEEEILRRATEKTLMLQQQQEHFDSVSYTEADEQFMNPLEGAEALDPTLRAIHPGSEAPITGRVLKLSAVAPFVAGGVPETRHSPLHQRRKVHPALQTVLEGATAPEGPPGFDWMCRNSSCGHINPGDEESCLRCGTHITPAEWECPLCASLNHLARSRCFYCKNRIPVCWTCSACQGTTSIYDKACRGCGMDRPAAEPRTVRELERGGGDHVGGYVPQGNRARGEWYCSTCNALNFSRRTECFQCTSPRPAVPDQGVADPFSAAGWGGTDSPGAAAVAAPVQHNNWMCAYCQASNFRTRHDCWKCGRTSERAEEWSSQALSPQYEREGFQEGANTKSAEGAMNASWKSAGDWLCAKCYSKNFRNRLECYRCGARKHALPATRSSSVRKPVKL